MKRISILLIIITSLSAAWAKVDLVTLPSQSTMQLTIYNSADLTLVRDSRELTLKQGTNRLQFSWENTLIDPTSLSMLPKSGADKIDISELSYPPRVRNLGLWSINSGISGNVPVEISYFTSALSWRAFYMGTLAKDEKTMTLEGYVVVANHSGQDYENAQTRLIVGQVHILDQIADLARREQPFGRPGMPPTAQPAAIGRMAGRAKGVVRGIEMKEALDLKEIIKEGLSEYFLYTIEGTETIPDGTSKRLSSFTASAVPVVNLYKFEDDRYGPSVIRFLNFRNNKDHKLGITPIPGGLLKVYRTVDDKAHLGYVGSSDFRYIPVDEDVELNLGPIADVVVEPKLMELVTKNYRFDKDGNITGWDQTADFSVEVRNTRDIPVKVQITRNFDSGNWELEKQGDFGQFEKIDLDTVRFTLSVEPFTKKSFTYKLTTQYGTRTD